MNKSKIHDDRKHIKARDFYDNFNASGKNRFRSLRKINQEQISYTLYCKIIKRFLLIYFYEVFFLDKPLFFLLGGKLKKCRISKFFTKRNVLINETVSFVWFMIPFNSLFARLRIDIQKGSSNIMPKLRKEFCQTNDVGLLPLKKELQKEFIERKIMFRL